MIDENQEIAKSVAGNKSMQLILKSIGGEVHDCKVEPEFFTKLSDAND